MNKQIQAYKELQSVIEKYPEEFKADYEIHKNLRHASHAEDTRALWDSSGVFSSTQYYVKRSYDNWTHVALYGGDNGQVSYLDKSYEQPNNEWLYCLCFISGAYIFGDSYPTEIFNAMWEEFKSYEPKYVSTNSHCLYFTEDKAKAVYDNFWVILNKYKGLVKVELLLKRKKELEEELAKLNGC